MSLFLLLLIYFFNINATVDLESDIFLQQGFHQNKEFQPIFLFLSSYLLVVYYEGLIDS